MDHSAIIFELALIFKSLAVSQALFLIISAKVAFKTQKTFLPTLLLAVGFSCYSFLFIFDGQSQAFKFVLAMNQTIPLALYFFVQSIVACDAQPWRRQKNMAIVLCNAVLIYLYAFAGLQSSTAFRSLITGWNVLLIAGACIELWRGYKDDLNRARTNLRLIVSLGLVIYPGVVGFISMNRPVGDPLHLLLAGEGALLTLMGIAINTVLVQPPVFSSVFAIERPAEAQKTALSQQLVELETLAQRVTHLMEVERLFLSQGLTLQDLATKAEAPIYRVRYLLNQHLGHENFSNFVNPYRLRYAAELLVNPSRSGDKIFAIALESGFSSLAPFNKAFKDLYGITPSEYRDLNLKSNSRQK